MPITACWRGKLTSQLQSFCLRGGGALRNLDFFLNYYEQLKNLKDLVDPMHRARLQHKIILHFPTNLKHFIDHKGHWIQFKEENLENILHILT